MKRNKNLFKLLKGNILLLIVVVFLTIIHRLTFSYVPLFSQILIEKLDFFMNGVTAIDKVNLPKIILEFINKNNEIISIVISIIVMMLLWQVARYILLFFENRLKGVLNQNVSKNIRMKSYNHIQNLSYEYHNNVDSGDLIQRVTSDIDSSTQFVSYSMMELIGLFSSLIFGAYQMYFINTTIMIVTLSLVPIAGIISMVYFKKIDRTYQIVEQKESELMVVIQENVSASRVVRAFGNEKYELKKLDEKNLAYRTIDIKAGRLVAVYWGIMDLIMMLQFLVVLLLGIYFTRKGLLDVSSVSGALMIAGMLIWPIRGLGRIINDYGKALVAANRLEEILELEDEYILDTTIKPEISGDIEFKNVSFKFNGDKNYILKNISFKINKGETIAIIGKTGSGKSTIINLLLKMYDYEGSILIDGYELREINKKHLRSSIGTVLQDPFLYSKTVYENIKIANKDASSDDILQASMIASIDKDIKTFSKGYETLVGEQGTTLSGGQKQRIAIARILVSKKPIIIFDDALSALDNKTDLEIRNALNNTKEVHTNIIITHRMTTAKASDKIIVLNNNTVENIGTHDELSKIEGLYKTLWDIQGQLEEEFDELKGEI